MDDDRIRVAPGLWSGAWVAVLLQWRTAWKDFDYISIIVPNRDIFVYVDPQDEEHLARMLLS